MILFSMLLSYLNTFFLVAKPSKSACFITRILPGFAFAMMYGALVTKTNRIARILAGSKKKIITRRPRFMSATSQVIITWIIVLMECFIIVFMLVREPADKMLDYPSDEKVVLVCNTTTMGIIGKRWRASKRAKLHLHLHLCAQFPFLAVCRLALVNEFSKRQKCTRFLSEIALIPTNPLNFSIRRRRPLTS